MDQKTDKIYPVRASDYKLYEEVGHGVSATVYRALCIPFNVIVAVKVLDLEKCNSNLDGIRREVQTMSLIGHPNILKAHCSFTADHSLWVVMPYLSGGSCLNIMKSAYPDGFEEAVIATFLREALKALEYLHSHGHIHRDIKAGNILVNGNGAIKLGDFGVSAFMFDSGDRQRSRNTFVGTPCWMAPEVMEQLHGYDFKADIWSFGITALELAHGNAPFSKYPPMKVLLMTLQNAPPGLDYERDKKFSKSFKEMVAMCLVKDTTKRPSATKLLKHRFFKHARSNDYIVRSVLDGLPPLGERLRILKLREMDRMGQNKMAYGEKEEKSQSEYIRGISAWNFDLEDLKAQAALIQDDDEIPSVKEQPVDSKITDGSLELMRLSLQCDSLSNIHSLRMDNTGKDGGHDIHAGPTPLSSLPKSINVLKEQFEVIDDDIHAGSPTQKESITEECTISAKVGKQDSNKDHKSREDVYHALVHGRRFLSAPLVPERVLASGDGDREKRQQRPQQRNFSGPLINRGRTDIDNSHEPSKPLEDKVVGPFVQQKGRFKVTTEDVNLKESTSKHPSLAPSSNVTILHSAIIRPLQNILEQNIMQREQIINLIKQMKQGETPSVQQYSNLGLQAANLGATENSRLEAFSDQEHVLLQQVAELQNRVGNLVDELQRLKIRNIQLEQQLNAALNREKEERNKKEATWHDL